jgi:hypothetical protein
MWREQKSHKLCYENASKCIWYAKRTFFNYKIPLFCSHSIKWNVMCDIFVISGCRSIKLLCGKKMHQELKLFVAFAYFCSLSYFTIICIKMCSSMCWLAILQQQKSTLNEWNGYWKSIKMPFISNLAMNKH